MTDLRTHASCNIYEKITFVSKINNKWMDIKEKEDISNLGIYYQQDVSLLVSFVLSECLRDNIIAYSTPLQITPTVKVSKYSEIHIGRPKNHKIHCVFKA